METQQVIGQFLHLPADAQRIVANLIAFLAQQPVGKNANIPAEVSAVGLQGEGAIMLPPLDLADVPTTWPENSFMNPAFYGAWAEREDMKDFDFSDWRRSIWERSKAQL